jgi:hypothetical protein
MWFLVSPIIRYGLGALAVVLATWFGGNYIGNILDDAAMLKVVQEQQRETSIKHTAEIEQERESRLVSEDKQREANERREHWRQSYYKLNGQFENYREATRVWVSTRYPDELDGLQHTESPVRDP